MSDKKSSKPTQASNEMGEVKVSKPSSSKGPNNSRVRVIVLIIVGILLLLCLCISAYLIDLYRKNNIQPNGQGEQSSQNGSNNNSGNNNGEGNANPAPAPAPTGQGNPQPAPTNQPQATPGINPSTSSSSTTNTGHSETGFAKMLANVAEINRNGVWKATQYSKGDIVSKTYVVQKGDTLWQIAKGYYGSGFQWKKILNANSSKIGFLPNGEQALILPNQVLTIP